MKWRTGAWILVCSCGLAAVAWAATVMQVQVREGHIRATPSFVGGIVSTVGYGQQIQVLENKGDWSQVSHGGAKGWMHMSALTDQELDLQAGAEAAQSGVSGKEMALAGKGFNAQVEAQYRQQNGGNYAQVDRMETQAFEPNQLMAFLQQGGVQPQGGAQ